MNRAEQKLVLELCRFQNPDVDRINYLKKQGIDQAAVLGQLMFHRVAGVAYVTLAENDLLSLFHREFRTSLRSAYQSACEKTKSFMENVDKLAEILNQSQVPYALLKGSKLCYTYPLGCRTSNDVDVLLSAKDLDAISHTLYANGYVQGHIRNQIFVPATRIELIQSRMTRGETVPFIKEISLPGMQFSEVDLNFSLHESNEQNNTVSELLNRRSLYQTNSTFAYTLSKYDFVLHLCAHLYKEASVMAWVRMDRDLSLYKFLDLYVILSDWGEEEYVQLLMGAISAHLARDVYYTLYWVRELFGITSMPLDNVLEHLELHLPGIGQVLDLVYDPVTKQRYRYMSSDLTKRLFTANRAKGLMLEKGSDTDEAT